MKITTVLVLALCVGCGSSGDEGGSGGMSGGGSGGMSAGGTGGTAADPVTPFLGTWSQIVSYTVICADGSTATESQTGIVLMTRGTTSDIVRAATGGGRICPVALNVSGRRATLAGAAPCSIDGATLLVSNWTFDLGVDDRSATEMGTAITALPQARGRCNASYSITLTK
jgi:hypothetical protein